MENQDKEIKMENVNNQPTFALYQGITYKIVKAVDIHGRPGYLIQKNNRRPLWVETPIWVETKDLDLY